MTACASQSAAPTPTAGTAKTTAAPAQRAATSAKSVTITLWSWFNKPFHALMPKWTAKNPSVKVNLVDISSGIRQKVLTALIAGTGAPDITGAQDYDLPILAATGGLADISQHMLSYKDKVVAYKLNNGTYKGKIYSVPWDGSPVALYYRRDIFTKQKIDATKISTYDDWLAVGQTLKEASGGKIKLMNIQKNNWYPLVPLAWQQGAGIYDVGTGNVIIDDDQAVQALTFIKKLWDADVVFHNIVGDAVNAAYKNGTLASFPGAIWAANGIQGTAPETSGKWGIVYLPIFNKSEVRATAYGGSQLAIPKQSKYVDQAFSFLAFTQLSQEGSTVMWEDGNLFPVLKDAVNWDIINKPVPFYGGQKALQLYAKVNTEIPPYFYGKGFVQASTIVGQAVTEALDGKTSPKQALASAAKQIRQKQHLQ